MLAGAAGGLGLASRDPKVAALHQRLAELNRKLAADELDIPPGGQPVVGVALGTVVRAAVGAGG